MFFDDEMQNDAMASDATEETTEATDMAAEGGEGEASAEGDDAAGEDNAEM